MLSSCQGTPPWEAVALRRSVRSSAVSLPQDYGGRLRGVQDNPEPPSGKPLPSGALSARHCIPRSLQAGLVGDHHQLGPVTDPQLAMARLTWVFTVAGLSTRRAAISSLDSPSTRTTTSRSRSVRSRSRHPRAAAVRVLGDDAAGDARDSSASPGHDPTPLIKSSGSVSLTRNPLAPGGASRCTVEVERGEDDHPSTTAGGRRCVHGSQPVQLRHADVSRAISGRSATANRTASAPVAASATTLMSGTVGPGTLPATPGRRVRGSQIPKKSHLNRTAGQPAATPPP